MKTRTLIEFLLAALIVIALGALSGWYFFLRGQNASTAAQDIARGFGTAAPNFTGALGSAYQNALSGFGAGGKDTSRSGPLPQLWQAEKTPVAGYGFVPNDTQLRLYFAQRSTGYLFSADPGMQTVARLSNTLMPKTYEAFFSTKGGVIERSVDATDSITTFVGALSASSSADSLKALTGSVLAKNILRIAVSPAGDEIFYLVKDSSGKTAGVRASWSGGNQKRLFTSSLQGWGVRWLSDGRIILVENPADNIAGYAYELKKDGALTPLIGVAPGLEITPRASSTALIYSTSSGGALTLFARGSATSSFVQLPIHTLAEKCVWAPSGAPVAYCAVPSVAPTGDFLTRWYRGEIHTTDAWWRVDVSAGTAHLFFSPESSLSLDVVDPVVDAGGQYIAFTNARDLSLWMLRINQ